MKKALKPLHERHLLALCRPTEYEMTHSARDTAAATGIGAWLHACAYLPTDDDAFRHAGGIAGRGVGGENTSTTAPNTGAEHRRRSRPVLHHQHRPRQPRRDLVPVRRHR